MRAWLFVLFSPSLWACPPVMLEDATTLVLSANPLLSEQQAVFQLQSQQMPWTSTINLTHGPGQTEGTGIGLTVKIPLFDRSLEIEQQKQKLQLEQQRQHLLKDFVEQLTGLCQQQGKLTLLVQQQAFIQDQLDYQQQRVDQGLAEAQSLWQPAAEYQEVMHHIAETASQIDLERYRLARTWGGEQWQQLQHLLADRSN